jgi:hypothetical protein
MRAYDNSYLHSHFNVLVQKFVGCVCFLICFVSFYLCASFVSIVLFFLCFIFFLSFFFFFQIQKYFLLKVLCTGSLCSYS